MNNQKFFYPITFVWLGFVLAISFFEAPIKFLAPSISIEEGVEIGQLVFNWMNKVELVFVILLSAPWVTNKMPAKEKWPLSLLFVIVLVQLIYLLPALDEQAQLLFDGKSGRNPFFHTAYVVCEIAKVLLLVILGRLQMISFCAMK